MLGNIKLYFTSKEFFKDLVFLIFAICIAKFISQFFMLSYVPTQSMYGTINDKNIVFVDKTEKTIKRKDIVVFKIPNDDRFFVKRVIGVPGDFFELRKGEVYINDEKLDEPYLYSNSIEMDIEGFTLEEDQYFMMGDNRDNSYDCRYWGPLILDDTYYVGKALFKILPPGKLK